MVLILSSIIIVLLGWVSSSTSWISLHRRGAYSSLRRLFQVHWLNHLRREQSRLSRIPSRWLASLRPSCRCYSEPYICKRLRLSWIWIRLFLSQWFMRIRICRLLVLVGCDGSSASTWWLWSSCPAYRRWISQITGHLVCLPLSQLSGSSLLLHYLASGWSEDL